MRGPPTPWRPASSPPAQPLLQDGACHHLPRRGGLPAGPLYLLLLSFMRGPSTPWRPASLPPAPTMGDCRLCVSFLSSSSSSSSSLSSSSFLSLFGFGFIMLMFSPKCE